MGNSSSSNSDTPNGTTAHHHEGGGRRRPSTLSSRGLSHRITGGGSNNNAGSSSSGGGGGGRSSGLHLPVSLPSPFRSGGSLGLSRSELDARCQPSGLYPTCEWDPKQIRRLISNGHLASRLRGSESRLTKTDRECPICFMYYSETNVSKCCNATLCTECYLQIKPQKDKHTSCPFCNNPKMQISVQRGMDEGDVAKREEEEQRVIEATIRSRVSELNGESPAPRKEDEDGGVDGRNADGGEETDDVGSSFGSSLEHYNRTRTRSDSFSTSSGNNNNNNDPGSPTSPISSPPRNNTTNDETSVIQSLAMSPADRRALESEMRAQLSHETHRRMESEAEEARMRHAQEWYGSSAGVRARMREARLAELQGLLERMGAARGGGGGLGMGGVGSGGVGNEDGEHENSLMADATGRGMGRGGAQSLSRLLRAMETSNLGGSREDLMRLEAAFFLGMDNQDNEHINHHASGGAGGGRRSQRNTFGGGRMHGRNSRGSNADSSDDTDTAEAIGAGDFGLGGRPSRNTFGGTPSSSRGSRTIRRGLAGNRSGVSSTHLDTAELLMRGVSEEEQLAMAIAMSMQDAQQQSQQQQSQESSQEGQQQRDSSSGTTSSSATGGGDALNNRLMAELTSRNSQELDEDDDSDSSSSSSSSSDSSQEERRNSNNDTAGGGGGGGSGNESSRRVSLESGEEEVTFTDVAEV